VGNIGEIDVCFFCDLCRRTTGVVQEESDTFARGKILDHVVVKGFQVWWIQLVKSFVRCYLTIMTENNLSEIPSRLDTLEIMFAKVNQRISKLERGPRNVSAKSDQPPQKRLDNLKPDEFKNFHGALFHRVRGRYENTVFCERCEIPLESSHDKNHLFKCPKCKKYVEFNPLELPALIKALEKNKS